MGEGGDDADDPYAPAHVAPAAAWLVSDRARDITGRVFEVGGDVLAVADGWRPTATAALPRDGAVSGVGVLIERLVAEAPAPHPVQRADATALVSL
jgi:hypothetical protein